MPRPMLPTACPSSTYAIARPFYAICVAPPIGHPVARPSPALSAEPVTVAFMTGDPRPAGNYRRALRTAYPALAVIAPGLPTAYRP